MNDTMQQKRWATPFFIIWTGQAFSLLGSALVQFALVWWLTETTGSATVLATATLVAMLPQVVLGPFAGTLVDRWNRRLLMIVADGITALAILVLAALFAAGVVQLWHVYVIMLVRAIAGTLHWPAMGASTALMVPEKQLARVAGFNQTLQGALQIVAPPLGAFLIAVLPLYGVLAIDLVTALLAILPLFFIAIPQPVKRLQRFQPGRASLFQEMWEGIRYVWGWPGLRLLLVMAMVLNMLGNPIRALLPLLVTRHFGGGALELGWMNSANGIGLVLGGLILGAWGGFRRRIVTSLTGIVGAGLAGLLIGLTPGTALTLALFATLLGGAMNAFVNGPIAAVLQARIAPEMQGRVMTVITSLGTAMAPLGTAIAGPFADALGVRAWYLLSGAITLLLGLTGFFLPALMHIEDNHKPETVNLLRTA